MFGIIAALLSGALMSIQGVFNTGVTEDRQGHGLPILLCSVRVFLSVLLYGFLKKEKRIRQ